jgi:hypothetical protein
VATRSLRAGPVAVELAEVKVAIVGCGAIGSFAADLLFRAGVRQLTLRDGERLRPGNVVRHLGGADQVGRAKTHAVRDCLTRVDTNIDGVKGQAKPLSASMTPWRSSVTMTSCSTRPETLWRAACSRLRRRPWVPVSGTWS